MTPVHAVAIVIVLTLAGTVPRQAKPMDVHMPWTFTVRVAEYVELHRRLAAGMTDSTLCADPEELSRQATALAAAIRGARPLADEGDIFTADVASAFRARIAYAIRSAGVDAMAADSEDEEWVIEANATLPWGTGRYVPPAIVNALPGLPAELEYRFVGDDLVLIDVEANLVVDVLRDAFPPPRFPALNRSFQPCDVHPDLPECWM